MRRRLSAILVDQAALGSGPLALPLGWHTEAVLQDLSFGANEVADPVADGGVAMPAGSACAARSSLSPEMLLPRRTRN